MALGRPTSGSDLYDPHEADRYDEQYDTQQYDAHFNPVNSTATIGEIRDVSNMDRPSTSGVATRPYRQPFDKALNFPHSHPNQLVGGTPENKRKNSEKRKRRRQLTKTALKNRDVSVMCTVDGASADKPEDQEDLQAHLQDDDDPTVKVNKAENESDAVKRKADDPLASLACNPRPLKKVMTPAERRRLLVITYDDCALRHLSQEDGDYVREKLEESIMFRPYSHPHAKVVKFTFSGGRVRMTCADDYTVNWMKISTGMIPPRPDGEVNLPFKAWQLDELPKFFRYSVLIPKKSCRLINEFVPELIRNYTLTEQDVRCFNTTSNDAGITLMLGITFAALASFQRDDMRPYVFLGRYNMTLSHGKQPSKPDAELPPPATESNPDNTM